MQVNHHISAIETELTPFFRSPAALEPDSANPSTIPLHIIACNRSRSHVLSSDRPFKPYYTKVANSQSLFVVFPGALHQPSYKKHATILESMRYATN